MNGRETIVHVEFAPWCGDAYALRLMDRNGNGQRSCAMPLTMTVCSEGDYVEPFVRLDASAAQQLMDGLWRAGVRPVDAQAGDSQVAAIQAHLADMRRIAFDHFLAKPAEQEASKP
jgi:hypothetical protein